jgi:hypothetical protein
MNYFERHLSTYGSDDFTGMVGSFVSLYVPGVGVKMTVVDDTVSHTEMVKALTERLAANRRPGGEIYKQLERITHHKTQLEDAIAELYRVYASMSSETRTRTSPAVKARIEMLRAMQPKVLRMFATSLGVDISDCILPDDIDVAINRILTTMEAHADKDEQVAE